MNDIDNEPSIRSYEATISWDVEGATPREAAEEMWDNVKISDGPLVELVGDDDVRVLVDLSNDPGDGDVTRDISVPSSLITRRQAERYAGRPLPSADMCRLAAAIPSSSIPDATAAITASFEPFS